VGSIPFTRSKSASKHLPFFKFPYFLMADNWQTTFL